MQIYNVNDVLQVVHDVDLQRLPVRFAMDRAGLVGADGPTHCGAFDITYMACLPNMVVMAPCDEAELMHMVATAAAIDDRPSCFRYPRGNGIGVPLPPNNKGTPLEVHLSLSLSLPPYKKLASIYHLYQLTIDKLEPGGEGQDFERRKQSGFIGIWDRSTKLLGSKQAVGGGWLLCYSC